MSRSSVVFPAPFGPTTPTMPAGGSVNGQAADERAVAVALDQVGRLDHHVAEARAGRHVDLDRVDLLRGVLGQQALVGVQARLALRLPGARRHRDPLQLALQRAPPLRLVLRLDV